MHIHIELKRVEADLLCLHQVIFYCHFPDLLLSTRSSVLHSLYRLPLDWAEQTSTGAADCILVNSKFTRGGALNPFGDLAMHQGAFQCCCRIKVLLSVRGFAHSVLHASPAGVFAETFRRLQRRGIVPGVLYPAVDTPSAEQLAADRQRAAAPELAQLLGGSGCFLSINRFERKKVCAMPACCATRSVFCVHDSSYCTLPFHPAQCCNRCTPHGSTSGSSGSSSGICSPPGI